MCYEQQHILTFLLDNKLCKTAEHCRRSYGRTDKPDTFLGSECRITKHRHKILDAAKRGDELTHILIYGILGALLGTYGAAQNYGVYPVLSFTNVVSGITHTIAGFASLYILISGMASMKKRNIGITFGILAGFCIAAYAANITLDYNYMFLMRGDGTPYDVLYNLVGGHPIVYPIGVVVLFLVYIVGYYAVYFLCTKKKAKETVTV
jgi:hypothetical protein